MDGWMAWYVGKYNFQTRNNILTSFNLTLYQWPENNRNNENWSKSLLFNLSKNCCNCQFFISSLVVTRAEFSVPISWCIWYSKIIACYYIGHVIYRVFIKYCVFPWNVVIFLNSASSAEALVFDLYKVIWI